MTGAFDVLRWSGSAVDFHAMPVDPTTGPALWHFDVARPAVALGSRQTAGVLDVARVEAAGIEIAQRRSGGGAVLLLPGEVVWVDVIVPAGHALWRDDIAAAMVAVGERWAVALAPVVAGTPTVHRGRLERSPWSDLVCFDGLGPGEVELAGRKLVGLSQRRTRATARFQCAVHLRYDAERLDGLLTGPLPRAPHRDVATLDAAVDVDALVAGLAHALAA